MSDTSGDPARREADRLARLLVPSTSAVLVQEMQAGVVGAASGLPALADAGASIGLVEKVAAVVRAARTAGVTVVHCTAENLPDGFGGNRNARVFVAARKAGMENAPGSDAVRPISEVGPESGDVVLPRYHGLSPMTGSPLDNLLRNAGVTTVVVAGVSLNVAIPNLVFDAVNRSYQVVVVSDAVVGVPVEYGEQVLAHTLSLVATLASADEVVEAWRSVESGSVE
ncbi:MAG TPA: isochorismatase family protein [Acidimicrobiales bacterium]|jgi:nicotinamidase-related amidase